MRVDPLYYLTVLAAAVSLVLSGSLSWAQQCGDLDDSGAIVTTDALLVLRRAVGQPVELVCPAVGLPRTGQSTCYDTAGAVVACAGTEQDGQVRAGKVRKFTNNGDGTITDRATGLMWEAKCDGTSCDALHDKDTTYTQDQAFTAHVAMLNSTSFAGHSDWRVPNVTELQSVVSYETVSPSTYGVFDTCAADCEVTGCSCTASSDFWSSTSFSSFANNALVVNFDNGFVFFGVKSSLRRVRAVRGDAAVVEGCGNGVLEAGEDCDFADLDGETCATQGLYGDGLACTPGTCVFDTSGCSATRYEDTGLGTVIDHQTGLEWEKKQNLDGTSVNCPGGISCGDPHDADNRYARCIGPADCNAVDGSVFTDFIGALNRCEDDGSRPVTGVTGGFAGHCDWRLPDIVELQTLIDVSAPGCGSGFGGPPCIDPIFGDTATGFEGYWSATPSSTFTNGAWYVSFAGPVTSSLQQRVSNYVRAVRVFE